VQEIRLAGGQQFFHLLGFDRALQDDPAGAEIATAFVADSLLAQVGNPVAEHSPAALGACA